MKFENFVIEKVKRKDIKKAPYNPRKIDETNQRKLKKYIRKKKLLSPAIIINKTTGNLVSGHQRIAVLDSLAKEKDYELTASIVELTPEEEVEANIKLNSQNLSGEWDSEKLFQVVNEFNLDFSKDLDFPEEEIDLLMAEVQDSFLLDHEEEEIYSEYQQANMASLKEAKDKYKAQMVEKNKDGTSEYIDNVNNSVTFIFKSNSEKADFMKRVGKSNDEQYLPASILKEIYGQKYKIVGGKP